MAESLVLTKKYRAIADLCEYLESLGLVKGWTIVLDQENQIYEVAEQLHSLLSKDLSYKRVLEKFLESTVNSSVDVVKPGLEMVNPLPESVDWELFSRVLEERWRIQHLEKLYMQS